MKNKIIGAAILTACTALAGTSAFARDNDHQDSHGHNGPPPQHQVDHNDHGHSNQGRHGHPPRHMAPPHAVPVHGRARGAGPQHNYYKGGHLPTQYRRHPYVIEDWRVHHLSEPPRGYYWVQSGSDFLLTAIATGLIAQVILNN